MLYNKSLSKRALTLSKQEVNYVQKREQQLGERSFLKAMLRAVHKMTNTCLGSGVCKNKISICYDKVTPGTQREKGKIPQRWKITQMINLGNQTDIPGFIKSDSMNTP